MADRRDAPSPVQRKKGVHVQEASQAGGAPFPLPKVLKMSLGTCGVQGMVLRYVGLFD